MASEKKGPPPDSEWERRVLCGDESCIGVIGHDGRCKECGLAYDGVVPWQAAGDQGGEGDTKDAEDPAPEETAGDGSPAEEETDGTESPDDEWEGRVLCRDENCIGVIGPDGRCKECGKPLREE